MSIPVEHSHADSLADEPGPRKRPSRAARQPIARPGLQVVVLCLFIDFALVVSTPVELLSIGAVYGIIAAQFTMAAIWLGMMATALYWMLAGVVLLCVAVLALLPMQGSWPLLVTIAWGGLTFTLPFALVRIAGFRLENWRDMPETSADNESLRFPLSRLFAWTFAIAALLGVYRWLPAGVAITLATSLAYSAVASIGLATLWAILWPGTLRRWRLLAPLGVLTFVVFFGQKARGWNTVFTIAMACAGVCFILMLAGLLALYRRAGMRLVAAGRGGWLVR